MDSENENPPTRTPRTPRTPLPTENERPPARTPLPDGYLPTIKPPAAQTKPPPASSEIQVPATQRGSKQANAQEEALPSSPHNSSQEDIPSDDRTELADNDNHIQAPDPNAELPPMDWADFQARFDKEMKKAGDEEDILWNEFDDMMLVRLFRFTTYAMKCYDMMANA